MCVESTRLVMKQLLRKYWEIARETGQRFLQDDPLDRGAAIAFYTIFSLPAGLLIIVVGLGMMFGQEVIMKEVMKVATSWVGPASASELASLVAHLEAGGSTRLATLLGMGTLLFSATTVFISIKGSLNAIWGVRPKPQRGYVKYVIDRALSFAMVLSLGFFLLVSLTFNTLLGLFSDLLLQSMSSKSIFLMTSLHAGVSFFLIFFIFALIFKVLPDARIRWKDVFVGALFATMLFRLGEFLVGLYLVKSSIVGAYGPTGSLIFILVWVYYSSVVLLIGAEFTHVYAMKHDRHILPKSNAVLIETREIEIDDGRDESP
jgi:membrane protein